MKYNIQITLGEFQLIFSSLLERQYKLEQEVQDMLLETRDFENGYFYEDEDRVKNPIRYTQMKKEIEEIKKLSQMLYDATEYGRV